MSNPTEPLRLATIIKSRLAALHGQTLMSQEITHQEIAEAHEEAIHLCELLAINGAEK